MYVDNTEKLSVVEWFTGYGGNELGLKRVIPNMQPIAFCEREAFVVANLVSKMEKGLMDSVPIWTDVTTFPIEPFKDRVGLFIASYPCQPFSSAGKRAGTNDDRHLWPYCRRFIQGARPGLVFLENVEGHVSLGLSTVLADLEEDGYTAAWGIFSASEVGAPHQRKRVFILARNTVAYRYYQHGHRTLPGSDATSDRVQKEHRTEQFCDRELGRTDAINELAYSGLFGQEVNEQQATGAIKYSEDVAHKFNEGLQGQHNGNASPESSAIGGTDSGAGGKCGLRGFNVWPSRPGERQYAWEPPRVVVDNSISGRREAADTCATRENCGERISPPSSNGRDGLSQTQSPMGGNADGPANGVDFPGCTGLSDTELEEVYGWMVKGTNRTDELRMCGNGVVPGTAARAWQVLSSELAGHTRTADVIQGELK